jgi:hypothetical protein
LESLSGDSRPVLYLEDNNQSTTQDENNREGSIKFQTSNLTNHNGLVKMQLSTMMGPMGGQGCPCPASLSWTAGTSKKTEKGSVKKESSKNLTILSGLAGMKGPQSGIPRPPLALSRVQRQFLDPTGSQLPATARVLFEGKVQEEQALPAVAGKEGDLHFGKLSTRLGLFIVFCLRP